MGRNRRRKRRRREADLARTAPGKGRQPSSFSRAVVVASAATALATGIFLAYRAGFITEPRSVACPDGTRAELAGPELVGEHSQVAFELEARLGDDSDLSQVIEPTQLRPSSEPPGSEACSRISWPIDTTPARSPGISLPNSATTCLPAKASGTRASRRCRTGLNHFPSQFNNTRIRPKPVSFPRNQATYNSRESRSGKRIWP